MENCSIVHFDFLLFLRISPKINLTHYVSEIGSNYSVEKNSLILFSTFTLTKTLVNLKVSSISIHGPDQEWLLQNSEGINCVFSEENPAHWEFYRTCPFLSKINKDIQSLFCLCFVVYLCGPYNSDVFQVNFKKFTHVSSVLNDS